MVIREKDVATGNERRGNMDCIWGSESVLGSNLRRMFHNFPR
jgi:hypothetical protein